MTNIPKPFNHPINHIALSVPCLETAMEFYTTILGFRILTPPNTISRSATPNAPVFDIYPTSLQAMKLALLTCGNGVGLELFEFEDPKMEMGEEANFERDYKRGGVFHVAVTVPCVEDMVAKVEEAGGALIGKMLNVFGYKAAYVKDPWGNVIEFLECSFEMLMGNRA
ncbi:hypothetical protein FPRO05_14204 [Fusarium proliferatum]|uniref:VOC domain-containing protein n=1 Tax=Gibberella intermedia TaxID=948311 RepID=A0A365MTJ6_GIBIN|nr:hypothetical protein FPRO05_14204 [Fusarium proliferatum]